MPYYSSPSCSDGVCGGNGRRDWSDLQYDLLFCIAGKLTTIDYITFRTVCRSWSFAVPEIPPYAPHAPYLLLGPDRNGDVPAGTETDIFNFLSIPDSTLHRFRIPKLVGKNCVGSQYGWLVTIDGARRELALLNPFTGQEIPLPPITPLVGPIPRIVVEDFVYEEDGTAVVKAVLSADPADGTALVVVAILCLTFGQSLIFTRVGDCKWHYFRNPDHYYYDVMFDPRGMRLLATAVGDQWRPCLVEIDVGSEEITAFVMDPHSTSDLGGHQLAAAHDVDDGGGGGGSSSVLYVPRHHSLHSRRTTHIEIFEAEFDRQYRRSKMTRPASLGGRALFVGAGSSVSLSAADVRRLKLKENHVYFSDNFWFLLSHDFGFGDDSGIYNLEDQDISFLIEIDQRTKDTINPHNGEPHSLSWLPPIWVSPSLRRRPTA